MIESGDDRELLDELGEHGPGAADHLAHQITQLLNPTGYPGLKGAAVTNTAAVGGAGITLALKLLKGEAVTTQAAKTVLLNPVAVDNTSDAGKATLKSWQVTGLNPSWPLGLKIDSWTTYTGEQAVACKGPGE